MKNKKIILTLAITCLMIPASLMAQDKTAKKNTVEKKVNVTENNGEKTVKVETTENGKTTKETYKGAEADAYLKKEEKEAKENPKIERKIIRKEEEKIEKKKEPKTK